MTAKDKFAVMYVQESLFWQVCNDLEWPESLRAQYREFGEKIKDFGRKNFPKRVTISGFNSEVSHYDIDDAVKRKFGDEVSCDSESNGIYIYVDEDKAEEVFNWIKENFKRTELVMETHEFNDFENPFVNWTDAKTYCKENGLDVPHPVDKETLKIAEDIKQWDENYKRKREQMLKSIK